MPDPQLPLRACLSILFSMLGQEAAIMKTNYQVQKKYGKSRVGIHPIYPVHESMISTRIYPMSLRWDLASRPGSWSLCVTHSCHLLLVGRDDVLPSGWFLQIFLNGLSNGQMMPNVILTSLKKAFQMGKMLLKWCWKMCCSLNHQLVFNHT